MRQLFIIIILFTPFGLLKGQDLTIGEAYDFEVGDEFCYTNSHEVYVVNYAYGQRGIRFNHICKKVLSKEFYHDANALRYQFKIHKIGCDTLDCWNTIDTTYEYIENLDSSVSTLVKQAHNYVNNGPYTEEDIEESDGTFYFTKRFKKSFVLGLTNHDKNYDMRIEWAKGMGMVSSYFVEHAYSGDYNYIESNKIRYYKKDKETHDSYWTKDSVVNNTMLHEFFNYNFGDELLYRHTYRADKHNDSIKYEYKKVLKKEITETHIDYTILKITYDAVDAQTNNNDITTNHSEITHERYALNIPLWIWWGVNKAKIQPGGYMGYDQSELRDTIADCEKDLTRMFTYINTFSYPDIKLQENFAKGLGLTYSNYYYYSWSFSLKGGGDDERERITDLIYYKKGTNTCGTLDTLVFLNTQDQYQTLPLQLYPNPVNETLNLQTDEQSYAKLHVRIINDLGKMEKKLTLKPKEQIDVSDLSPGLYLLQVQQNRRRATQSFFRE